MADDTVAEAIRLMSSMAQDGIEKALRESLDGPFQILLHDDGGQEALEAESDTDFAARIDQILHAAGKCGTPKTKADLMANDALRAALTRHAVAVADLGGGTWGTAAWAGAFDMHVLFDGPFRRGLSQIGIGGLFGSVGAVGGLSAWMSHPFFGNSMVLGILFGSAFGAVSLVSTGDWARFGKGVGLGVVGTAAAWGGATTGAYVGAALGPVGAVVGGLVGGVSAAFYGRRAAMQIPGLGGVTDHEVQTMHAAIVQELAAAGLEPDPSLTPKQVVAATTALGSRRGGDGGDGGGGGNAPLPFRVRMTGAMAADVVELRTALLGLQDVSPEGFDAFVDGLRAMSGKEE